MLPDVYDGRTKAQKKSEAAQGIRVQAMQLALGLPPGLLTRTAKDIVANAAVIER